MKNVQEKSQLKQRKDNRQKQVISPCCSPLLQHACYISLQQEHKASLFPDGAPLLSVPGRTVESVKFPDDDAFAIGANSKGFPLPAMDILHFLCCDTFRLFFVCRDLRRKAQKGSGNGVSELANPAREHKGDLRTTASLARQGNCGSQSSWGKPVVRIEGLSCGNSGNRKLRRERGSKSPRLGRPQESAARKVSRGGCTKQEGLSSKSASLFLQLKPPTRACRAQFKCGLGMHSYRKVSNVLVPG